MTDGGRHRRCHWPSKDSIRANEEDLLKSDDEILGGAAVKMNLNLFRYIAADATRCEFEDVKIKLMPGIASLSKRVTISPPYDYQKDHLEICIAMSKMFNGLFFIIPTRGGFVVFEE